MSTIERKDTLPVAVIGAGPTGLAAAARLTLERTPFVLLEAGERPGATVRQWGHVRLFTPWRYLIDDAARALLVESGWRAPDPEVVPTGGELVTEYIEPLARLRPIADVMRLETRVTAVTRLGMDKLKTDGRDARPFVVRTTDRHGRRRTVLARAVIDASGTWDTPNPLGADGVPADGEDDLGARLYYGIPDVLGRDRPRYAGKRVGVVGSGHSAFNVLLDLQGLNGEEAATVTWFIRSGDTRFLFGGEDADALTERGALGRRMRLLAESGRMTIETGFRTGGLREDDGGIVLESEGGRTSSVLDEVVVATGFRPDFSFARELRLELDPAVEAPRPLAPLIDPNVHSCGTVPPHGYRELSHPEPGFFIVGMKSYGRAPTFLMLTGYEQVRSVVKAIVGDFEAAERVELDLPETGVCSVDLGRVAAAAQVEAAASCCGPAPVVEEPASCCGSQPVTALSEAGAG